MSRSTEEAGPAANRPASSEANGSSSSGSTDSRSPPRGEPDAVSELAQRLLERGAGVLDQLLRLVRISADLGLQRARHARSRLLVGFLLTTAAAVVLVSALVLFARGLSSGLGAWLGTPWLGELAAGLVLLGLLFAGSWSVRRQGDRARIRKLKEKYEGDDDTKREERHPAPPRTAPTQDT